MSMSKTLNGKIIKGIGGFYYVEAANQVYECKARGVFRKEKTTPLCGDVVTISVNDGAENTIDEIHPRKNQLMRPPVANIDSLIIVASTVKPRPSTLVIDKLTAVAEHKNIEPVIIVTRMIWHLQMSLCLFISMRALSLLPFQTKQARESVKSENCFAENKRFYREFGSRKNFSFKQDCSRTEACHLRDKREARQRPTHHA